MRAYRCNVSIDSAVSMLFTPASPYPSNPSTSRPFTAHARALRLRSEIIKGNFTVRSTPKMKPIMTFSVFVTATSAKLVPQAWHAFCVFAQGRPQFTQTSRHASLQEGPRMKGPSRRCRGRLATWARLKQLTRLRPHVLVNAGTVSHFKGAPSQEHAST